KTGSATMTISVDSFENDGTFSLQNGTVNLSTPDASQSGTNPLTSLEGGDLQISYNGGDGTYVIKSGVVRGSGTINGNLKNGNYIGTQGMGSLVPGGTIMPGTDSVGDTLTITGNFDNYTGTVQINVFSLTN